MNCWRLLSKNSASSYCSMASTNASNCSFCASFNSTDPVTSSRSSYIVLKSYHASNTGSTFSSSESDEDGLSEEDMIDSSIRFFPEEDNVGLT